MIARLRGELVELDGLMALVDAGGVGYEVAIPESLLPGLPSPGEEVILLIRQIFREDGVSLYGFSTSFQRRLFDILLGVKGCGPKVALSLLGTLGEAEIVSAVQLEDPRRLARANGVGPKLAERIILETKDKIQEEAARQRIEASISRPVPSSHQDDELVEALMALGYRRNEAQTAAAGANDSPGTVQDRLKVALQILRK